MASWFYPGSRVCPGSYQGGYLDVEVYVGKKSEDQDAPK